MNKHLATEYISVTFFFIAIKVNLYISIFYSCNFFVRGTFNFTRIIKKIKLNAINSTEESTWNLFRFGLHTERKNYSMHVALHPKSFPR